MDTPIDVQTDPTDMTQPWYTRMRGWYHQLPDKKKYLELITAFLSVPVLVTVLISNVNNLQNNKKQQATPTPIIIQDTTTPVTRPTAAQVAITPTPSTTPGISCTAGIGPVAIDYPAENDVIPANHVYLNISRQGNYCSVQYADRVNGGAWSGLTSGTISLDNLPNGPVTVELKVHSMVTGEETVLTRHFTVGTVTPTLTPTPTSTASAGLQ